MSGIMRLVKAESTQYTSVPNWVVRSPNYSPNSFRLLSYLLSHVDGYKITYEQISRQTTLGRYAINEAVKFLSDEGWLEVRRDKGADGRWLAKTWILRNPTASHSTADDSTVEPFHYGTANGLKEEQVKEKPKVKRNTLSESDFEAVFSQFWDSYPKRIDKGKAKQALKAALKRASAETILKAAIAYRDDPARKPDYTKYPATWLNADAWENEVETKKAAPSIWNREE